MVARLQLHNMTQDTDEPVRNFAARLRGKAAVRAYWAPSLTADPPLEFELMDVLVGVDSLTLYYRNRGRRVARCLQNTNCHAGGCLFSVAIGNGRRDDVQAAA